MSKEEIKAAAKLKALQAKEAAKARKAAKSNPQLVHMPEQTGNAEVDSLADLDEVKRGFRERARAEAGRFQAVTDSEYWFAVCFKTREQKERFLRVMEWIDLGDKYLPGLEIARRMDVGLPDADLGKTEPKIDKDFAARAM